MPSEVLSAEVACGESHFKSLVLHAGPIDDGRRKACFKRQHARTDEVGAFAIIVIGTQVDGVVE